MVTFRVDLPTMWDEKNQLLEPRSRQVVLPSLSYKHIETQRKFYEQLKAYAEQAQ